MNEQPTPDHPDQPEGAAPLWELGGSDAPPPPPPPAATPGGNANFGDDDAPGSWDAGQAASAAGNDGWDDGPSAGAPPPPPPPPPPPAPGGGDDDDFGAADFGAPGDDAPGLVDDGGLDDDDEVLETAERVESAADLVAPPGAWQEDDDPPVDDARPDDDLMSRAGPMPSSALPAHASSMAPGPAGASQQPLPVSNAHQRPAEGAGGASKDPDAVIASYERSRAAIPSASGRVARAAVLNEGIERLKRNKINKSIGENLVEVRNLKTHFTLGTETIKAVDGITFDIRKGETFCLVGESGSGKSITAMSIMQLIPKSISSHPGDGRIVFHHRQDDGSVRAVNILEQDDESMRHIRGARISMIFQEPMTSLNPVHTIGDQIAEALLLHTPLRGKAMWARVLELLEMVEIPDAKNRMKDYPHRLSGGQRQRVMIAIAMACEPDLLIADEPTTALDVTIQAQILELMNELQRRKQMSILFITHDIGVVNIMADRVAVMQKGKIVEIGELDQVVRNPQHDYTKQLIAALPEQLRLERDAERERHAAAVAAGTEELTHAEQMMAADEPLVWMEQLQVYFPIRKGLLRRTVGYVKAVDNVDLTIRKGRILALVGESGSGKTTLGRAILRLVEPTGGSVYYAGSGGDAEQFAHADVPGGIGSNGSAPVELTGISLSAMRPFRRDLQFIFQDPYSSLNPRLRIVTTLTEPMAVHGIGSSRDERTELAAQMMVKMDLQRDMLFRYPHEFSGGQRQRIGMARALLLNPRFIVCDEVTSALDVSVQAEILRLLLQLREEFDLTLLFITHNIAVVEYLADEVAVMHQGKIVERGLADDVCRNPQHEYSQKLLSAVPRVDV